MTDLYLYRRLAHLSQTKRALLASQLDLQATTAATTPEYSETKHLLGYIVARKGQSLGTGELRSFLSEKLPEYMIPSAFVMLEALPLTPNGKLDRGTLSDLVQTSPEMVKKYVEPLTTTEAMLCGIWAKVLGVERVGVEDNFFELGGHSLLATQVVSRIREGFGVELAVRKLFEEPTVRGLAVMLERVREVEQAGTKISRAERNGKELPLSFAQQRLWFLDRLEPDNITYNMPTAIQLSGSLNVEALEQTWSEIIRRHESLRTTFRSNDGEPVQVIAPAQEVHLPLTDLSQHKEAEREREVERLAREEAQRPFDLTVGPLLRVSLLRLGQQEHVVLLTMHHIISDGWSMGVLIKEVVTLYEAFAQKAASPLPELAIQYADYAVWQREYLRGEVLEEQLAYWKQQLAGAPPVLELPTDFPRLNVKSFSGAVLPVDLPRSLTSELKALSQGQDATLFMTLLAAFQLLLSHYTGQLDIVVGTPIANRTRTELEPLIGFFVNMLVLRTDLSGNPSFTKLLARVKEVSLGAYAHQEMPFEKLVEEVQPERELNRNPLFDVTFALQNAPQEDLTLPNLSWRTMEVSTETSRFMLSLDLEEADNELRGTLVYNSELFTAERMSRLVMHFRQLLESIVAAPEQRIGSLSLLGNEEVAAVVDGWNQTTNNYPREQCVHELFEAQVEKNPAAVAVVFRDEEVTYEELNQRANQLAHRLLELGVRPDVVVGLMVERSVEMVVGLLGILKAGGAYLPLDAEYPAERLSLMMKDAELQVLLTQQKLKALPPVAPGTRVICLDSDWEDEIGSQPEQNPVNSATADNLAYVLYTSGSTGRPKGLAAIHRGVVRLVKETNYADLNENEVFLQLGPLSFDASTFEIWGALLNGARLVVFPPDALSLSDLGEVLQRYEVTTLWLTAGLFHQMVEEHPEKLAHLRQLLAGGDVLSVPHAEKALRAMGGKGRLINGYGPTENTTFTCYFPITTDEIGASVPIGRPVANTQVYILDRYLQPAPIGVPGELYIGGDGLARGYLQRPDMTAEKFIPDPFGRQAGSRLYKTGDMVRTRADGNLEFLGRIDQQVKVRGFRIELGEVEAALSQHSAVSEAVVVVKGNGLDDKRLIAYVVARAERSLTVNDLHNFMKQTLPQFMVPSAFIMLDELPLTPNGKVDREALPVPGGARPNAESFEPPSTELEHRIAAVWQELLQIDKVGMHDSFFDLGGHSLLLVRVHSRLQKLLKPDLAIIDLFRYPTISTLSSYLSNGTNEETSLQDEHLSVSLNEGKKRLRQRLSLSQQA